MTGPPPAPDPDLRLLLATRVGEVGGAEQVVLTLREGLAGEARVQVTTTPLPWEDGGPLPGPGSRADLRELLAGSHRILHTHLFLPGLLARLRRIWDPDIRWVHTVHYHGYEGLSFPRLRAFLDRRLVFPTTDVLLAVSPVVADGVGPLPHLRTVENPVDLPAAPPPLPPPAPGRDPVVGCVAMLRREKGVDLLLEAAARLRDAGTPVRVRVAGEGPERGALEARIRALRLQDQVELCGYVDPLGDFLGELDLYVQPSRSESFGLAAFLALGKTLPLVVTDAGNLPAVAGGGAFARVVPAAAEELARGIAETLRDLAGARAQALAGRDHWSARLSTERFLDAHRAAYRDALRPRVVYLAALATHGGGGIPRQTLLQTRGLARLGHRVFLLQRRDPGRATDPVREGRWRHLQLLETADPAALGVRLRGFLFTVLGALRLWWSRRRYDVVHAHQLYSPALAAVLAGLLTGKPVVVKVTSSGEGVGEVAELRRLPFPRLRWWLLRRIRRVIALTPAMARELVAAGFPPERVTVIPNAVEVPEEPVSQPRRASGAYRVVFTGRLSTEKALETLVDAVALLRGRGIPVQAELVGGPDPDRDATPALQDAVRAHGLQDAIHLLGPRAMVEPHLRDADAFVLPSRNEGMSNALLEAMALGMVCVVSDIPQNRALVQEGENGILFPVGDASGLARVLEAAYRDREAGGIQARRLGDAARAAIQAGFSSDAVARRISRLYDEVVGVRRPG